MADKLYKQYKYGDLAVIYVLLWIIRKNRYCIFIWKRNHCILNHCIIDNSGSTDFHSCGPVFLKLVNGANKRVRI